MGPAAGEDDTDSPQQDFEVIPQAAILQIEKIKIDFAPEAVEIRVVAVDDLGQTRQPRFQSQAVDIVRNFFRQSFNEFRPFGTRANERHFTAEHVP